MLIAKPDPRFMIVGVFPKSTDIEIMLNEFEETQSLVNTFGGTVHACTYQRSNRIIQATYIGSGKAQEVADSIIKEKIDIVVIHGNAKPGQLFTLKKIFLRANTEIEVWDRIDLILFIFSKHAHTKEAHLQILLAGMRHMGPRIYGMGHILSQQAGGIGTRGIGETNVELMKRHWKKEIHFVREQLDNLAHERMDQIKKRKDMNLPTISLVGYTNAGKTSLFNTLCGKKKEVNDALFVTLDSSVGKLYLPRLKRHFLVSDTIGFIRNLPPELIDAFRSTLLESVHADLLLHVIDVSDKNLYEKIAVVEEILKNLRASQQKIFVFTKADKGAPYQENALLERFHEYSPLFVSTKTGEGIKSLVTKIEGFIASERQK